MPNPKVGPPQEPSFWHQVPSSIWRRLDLAEILRDALIALNDPKPYGPVIALHSFESYVVAGKRQQRRVARAMSAPWNQKRKGRSSLFDDTHFYLIAWARIAKLAAFISRKTRFRRIGLVLRRYKADLDDRIAGRNHLEHFEDRLPGGPQEKKLSVPNDLFNMSNNIMTYGGRTLDIGSSSLDLLSAFVREFRAALRYDAVETLATTDVDRLKRQLDRAASQLHVARVTKKAMKTLNEPGTENLSVGIRQKPPNPYKAHGCQEAHNSISAFFLFRV